MSVGAVDDALSEASIVDSWNKNAAPWTLAVRTGQIESRQLVTDRAVLEAVLSRTPRSVLDIGCGEGWLARALSARGIDVLGVDIVPELIHKAREAGGGEFRVSPYEDLATGAAGVRFDVAVCNFSLLGKDSVETVLRSCPACLTAHGSLVIQTLHPLSACGEVPYEDGWRAGSWAGFNSGFTDPAPWYFRTLGSWINLIGRCGLSLQELREPLHPTSGRPVSVVFIIGR